MYAWELFTIGFAVLVGIFSFRINKRVFTAIFRQMERNFNQNLDVKTNTDHTDPERSGTLLSASTSIILAYYIWKNPHIFSLLVVSAIILIGVIIYLRK